MQRALDEMGRRRGIQQAHNVEHGIIPTSIRKSVDQVRLSTRVADARVREERPSAPAPVERLDTEALLGQLEQQMHEAAANLNFELAAQLRDQILELKAAGDPVRRTPAGVTRERGASTTRRRARTRRA